MVRDRKLQEVAGNAFVAKDRPRLFNGGTDIKILALRVVGGNEIKAGAVFVVNAGSIHESAGRGRLEGFWKLADLKVSEIWRQRHQVLLLQELDHRAFAALV